ncbi:MAG: nickel pincer cofactor biosynthesis protein LarB [Pseudomonadota bacterium]
MSSPITMDWDRHSRTGLHEAVMCQGKTPELLQHILQLAEVKQQALLFTRLDASAAATLHCTIGNFDYEDISRTAIYTPALHKSAQRDDRIAVISGGSTDIPVAREAVRTLGFYGVTANEVYDIGVAGLWRLHDKLTLLREQKILICVAGMDAALPTVLAGLVSNLIIAVPTSTGYGMTRGGETALHALLCSCSQGLVVVNIDNGFGAACAAIRALAE